MNEVVIAYITDDNYVMPTIVSITSAIMNKNESSIYKIFIIGVSINDENKKIIEEFISKNINDKIYLNIMHFNQHYNFDDSHPYVTSAAIFKFDIVNILSDYDKVLYIDCDTIILKDLTELFEINLNDYYAAVVKDYYVMEISKHGEIIGVENYFNSGVMLLNTKLLRKDNVKGLLLDYKINKDRQRFMDQDCFNYIFNNKVRFISVKYNCIINFWEDYNHEVLYNFYDYDIFKEEIVVMHLAGPKPFSKDMPYINYFYDFYYYYQYTDYFKNNPLWLVDIISEQKLKSINERLNILKTEVNKKYSENWIKFFGIYNNSDYIFIYIFFIKFTIKINEKNINKLAWWIPVRKWRDNFRNKFSK